MPMWRRAWRNLAPPSMVNSSPSSLIEPEVGSTSRLIQRMRVDLPAPEEPITATTWGWESVRLTPCSARRPLGYCFTRSLISSMPPTRLKKPPGPPPQLAGDGPSVRWSASESLLFLLLFLLLDLETGQGFLGIDGSVGLLDGADVGPVVPEGNRNEAV